MGMSARFPRTSPKNGKDQRGRTPVATTPIEIRPKLSLTDRFEEHVRSRLASRIGHAAPLIERGTVRFEDVNGPKGGVDTKCKIHLVMTSAPPIQVEERGERPDDAFKYALDTLATTLRRTQDKQKLRVHPRGGGGRGPAPRRAGELEGDAGSLIGRRVGRGAASRAEALARPEKGRRDAYVDTAAAGRSETDRKAGGGATARRNTLAKPSRATAALEDSRTTPSRKSTRRSANRGKPSQTKERAAVARSLRPSAKASRGAARRS